MKQGISGDSVWQILGAFPNGRVNSDAAWWALSGRYFILQHRRPDAERYKYSSTRVFNVEREAKDVKFADNLRSIPSLIHLHVKMHRKQRWDMEDG